MNAPYTEDIDELLLRMGEAARAASRVLAKSDKSQRAAALHAIAVALVAREKQILSANARDIEAALKAGVTPAFVDRMKLSPAAVQGMAKGIETVAWLPDPLGDAEAEWTRPNGLKIARVRVPIGVIGIIYESRPNVTADAAALCIKSGNAAILRGGSEALGSARAIQAAIAEGLERVGLPKEAVQLVPTADRAAVGRMLNGLDGAIDVIIPRGGKSLIARVQKDARVPVLAHLDGNCHVYVDKAADAGKALDIVMNSKMRRVSVCGAAETLLIDAAGAGRLLRPLVLALLDAGCEVRGDRIVQTVDPRVLAALDRDLAGSLELVEVDQVVDVGHRRALVAVDARVAVEREPDALRPVVGAPVPGDPLGRLGGRREGLRSEPSGETLHAQRHGERPRREERGLRGDRDAIVPRGPREPHSDDDQDDGGCRRDPGPHDAAPAGVLVDLVETGFEDLLLLRGVRAHGCLLRLGVQSGGDGGVEVVHAHASIRFCSAAVARKACCFTDPVETPSQAAICSSERSR